MLSRPDPTPSVWAQGLSGLSGWAQGRLAPPLPDTPHSCLAPTLDREKVGGNTEPSPGSVPLSWRRLSSEMEARPPPTGKPKASLSLHRATWGGEGGEQWKEFSPVGPQEHGPQVLLRGFLGAEHLLPPLRGPGGPE